MSSISCPISLDTPIPPQIPHPGPQPSTTTTPSKSESTRISEIPSVSMTITVCCQEDSRSSLNETVIRLLLAFRLFENSCILRNRENKRLHFCGSKPICKIISDRNKNIHSISRTQARGRLV